MSIRAILFDLDNTLYPATSGVMQGIDRRIGEYVEQRLGLSPVEAAEVKRHYYTTYGTTLRGLQQHYGPLETDEYLSFVHDVGIEDLLRYDAELDAALERLDVPKVIFTNSPREHAERVLAAMGLAHHFERIFDLRYFEFAGKPDPRCYQRVLEQLGVMGAETLLLEDTPQNLGPARALGMTTMLICDGTFVCPDADYRPATIEEALRAAETLVVPTIELLRQPVASRREPVSVRRSA